MKTNLLILFLLFPFFLYAQVNISGRILDKDTQEPVQDVAVYTNISKKITLTDSEGQYSLIVNQSEPVYFRQLAYDFVVILSDSLLLSPNIHLTRNIISLNEVVVTPENMQILLHKAIQNLLVRFQKNKTKTYLYHIEETTDMGGEREAYASIEAGLTNINSKKGMMKWDINLIQLDKKIRLEDSFRLKKLRVMQIELFPQKIAIYSELDKYKYEFYESDDEQLIIKASPKKLDKEHYRYHLYTINKQDTVLTEYISQSFSNTSEVTIQKFLSLTRQTLNHFSRVKFVQDELSDLYYIKELQNIGRYKRSINSLANVFSFKVNANEIVINPINSRKKIKPYDYVLFENDFPESSGFWKQYVK